MVGCKEEGGVKVGWDTGEDGGGGEREEEQERGRGRSGTRHLERTLHLLSEGEGGRKRGGA